jgi:hypothetical protein
MRFAALILVAVGGTAAADDIELPSLENEGFISKFGDPPRFAFTGKNAHVSPAQRDVALDEGYTMTSLGGMTGNREVRALSADKKAYWIAADLTEFVIGCGMAPCPPPPPPPPAQYHATALWQLGAKDWEIVAWDVGNVVDGKAQAASIKKGDVPAPIAKKIDAGAEDVVKLFESTIGDPKALAATVSARKDVVLYGNEAKERTQGGAKVKAKLEAWKLGFKVRDGIQAGVTKSKTVAWVAANVDSTSAKKPKDKPVPYRLFAIYEKTGAEWKLVHANFTYIVDEE